MIRATFAGFNTALTAIQSNLKRLDITGQNLSNMNTVGYTRQQLDTSSLNYTGSYSHYMSGSEIQVGFGVAMDGVTQIRDPYLDAQYRSQMEKSGYTEAMQTSLDSLSQIFDETDFDGIRAAFDDVLAVLDNLQDPAKTNDTVYETELRVKMEALTNLLNGASEDILEARELEYQRLDGEGTNQNGAEQTVNDILKQIGELNRSIKHNQIFGQPSLELMDERNVLLDELSSYIPIEVTYYKDDEHTTDGDWPDDLQVDLVYYDSDGAKQTLTLVDGTKGSKSDNYGSLDMANADGSTENIEMPYSNVMAKFTGAKTAGGASVYIAGEDGENKENQCNGGSIQAGLDMLAGKEILGTEENPASVADIENVNVRSYQYYMNHLNNLAQGFAKVMNELNILGNQNDESAILLKNNETGEGKNITAANIRISDGWISGTVSLGKGIEAEGNNFNDTVLAMLGAMSTRYSAASDQAEVGSHFGVDFGSNSFADYTNHISTVLATDSASNQTALKTNVTVLNGIQDSRDSVSGVSLDEEAANMMTYLAAYNAASRLMTTLDEALDTLINSTGLVGR